MYIVYNKKYFLSSSKYINIILLSYLSKLFYFMWYNLKNTSNAKKIGPLSNKMDWIIYTGTLGSQTNDNLAFLENIFYLRLLFIRDPLITVCIMRVFKKKIVQLRYIIKSRMIKWRSIRLYFSVRTNIIF